MTGKVHLVTGASGLVGRALVEKLSARGDQVIALDRAAATVAGVTVVDCDLRDTHRLYRLVGRRPVDAVFHCGAYSGPMLARDNPVDLAAVNVTGTVNMLELARNIGVRRFINCSSVSVYGSTVAGPVSEESVLHPSTVYGATKLAAEALATTFGREHGLAVASFRLSWVYGPNRTTPCLLRRMVEDAIAGHPTVMPWGEGFFRQYIHADDAAAGMIAAIDVPTLKVGIFNLTGGDYRTLGDVAKLVTKVVPAARISLGDGPDPGDDIQHEFDMTAARQYLGYIPQIGLEDGIRQFAEVLRLRASQEISA